MAEIIIPPNTWYCSVCGSMDVEFNTWVKANTGEDTGSDINGVEDQWCCDCEEHVEIISNDEPGEIVFVPEEKAAEGQDD